MDLVNLLTSGAGSGVMSQFAARFGVTPEQAASVVSTATPALAGGLKQKLDSRTAGGLLSTLTSGTLNKFADDPSLLSTPAAAEAGSGLLGQLFSGDSLTKLTGMVSEKTGVSSGVIQTMLPVIVTMVMGFLSKKSEGDPAKLTSALGALSGHEGVMGAVKAMAHKIFG
jgi:hypothetical protein